jgi:cobalamin biosynthesis Mg chelatase CobN
MRHIMTDLCWCKSAVLEALGHEMEAQRVKEDLVSKDSKRVFHFELKHHAAIAQALKLELEYAQKMQNMREGRSQKAPEQRGLEESQKPQQPETASSIVPTHRSTAATRARERSPGEETAGKSKPVVAQGENPGAVDTFDASLFIWLGAAAIAVCFLFVLWRRRAR